MVNITFKQHEQPFNLLVKRPKNINSEDLTITLNPYVRT